MDNNTVRVNVLNGRNLMVGDLISDPIYLDPTYCPIPISTSNSTSEPEFKYKKVIEDLEEWLKNYENIGTFKLVYDKLQELKESDLK